MSSIIFPFFEKVFSVEAVAEFGLFPYGNGYVTITGHICPISMIEVIMIRKTISVFLILLGLLLLAPGVEAATLSSKAGAVTTREGKLNVRETTSSHAAVLSVLNKGSYVTLISRSGDWWKVEYAKGKYGYCHADFITIVEGTPVTVNTQTGSLNVRSGAGTSYGKVGTLAKGETVIFLKESGGWSRVLYHGTKTGWVSAPYLSNYYGAVSLGVPSFKQTDSRWANKTIGTSGKTFTQIGCATTAVAMMESYRLGKTIYPDAMAAQLRYTPGGDLYWPEHYQSVTNGNGYLKAVYDRLKVGKPVLLGGKNAYGSQHWVVVTGFGGGTALSAGNFTVHDPGSSSRKTLGQFLSAYPTFYKFFAW